MCLLSAALVQARPYTLPSSWNCKSYVTTSEETCQSVTERFTLTRHMLQKLNPGLDCDEELKEGTQLCVEIVAADQSSHVKPEASRTLWKPAKHPAMPSAYYSPPQPLIRFG
ncbi:hypothetical protein AAVH_43465 [Aphelenchoides avenae]|nr:hypothetical protein AAVH_43465 [Aphelenchus avenae]